MSKFKKLIFSSIVSFLLLFNLAIPFANAQGPLWYQGPWYDQGPVQWYSKVYDSTNPQEIFGERYTAAQVQWIIYSLFSVVVNTFVDPGVIICISTLDVASCPEAVINTMKQWLSSPFDFWHADASTGSSLASEQANQSLISAVFADRPLSGISYIRHIGSSLHIIPATYAQGPGYGYSSLTFIQSLWQGARDITYGLMIIIIIAMSFMIMFRVKLSPQTVISVQSALPKIIITLILVTFSYAIAGLMIDLMYVVIGLISLAFTQAQIFNLSATQLFEQLTNGAINLGAFGLMYFYWTRFTIALGGIILSPSGLFSQIVVIPSAFIGLIIMLIVSIILILVTFRVLWMLIRTFINVILLAIAGPFIISFGAISSQGGGFGGWIRSFAAQLAVYPVTGVMFLVSFIFLAAAYYLGTSNLPFGVDIFGVNPGLFTQNNSWAPPLTLGGIDNLWGLRMLWLFASLGTIALTPRVNEIIQSFITKRPFQYGTAIGAAITPATGFAEKQSLGRLGAYSGNRLLQNKGNFVDRFVANTAARRGHIDIPSVSGSVRRKGTLG